MLRASAVVFSLAVLAAAPVAALVAEGLAPAELPAAAWVGLEGAIGSVGWVIVPQIALAVAILGLALEQLATRLAGLSPPASPAWLPAAVESALLLGMLGTISGMVTGFVELSGDSLEPAPLIQSLGRALRSSFVGFGIALVGVWTRSPAPAEVRA